MVPTSDGRIRDAWEVVKLRSHKFRSPFSTKRRALWRQVLPFTIAFSPSPREGSPSRDSEKRGRDTRALRKSASRTDSSCGELARNGDRLRMDFARSALEYDASRHRRS